MSCSNISLSFCSACWACFSLALVSSLSVVPLSESSFSSLIRWLLSWIASSSLCSSPSWACILARIFSFVWIAALTSSFCASNCALAAIRLLSIFSCSCSRTERMAAQFVRFSFNSEICVSCSCMVLCIDSMRSFNRLWRTR